MSKQTFIEKRFRKDSLATIETAENIMTEYAENGYDLTLRQLYYQFVSRGLIENTQRSYKNLGKLVSDGRMAGLLDWSQLTDRTRYLRGRGTESSPSNAIWHMAYSYRENLWLTQPTYVEVWVEKEALSSIISHSCSFGVDYFATKGYASSSSMKSRAETFIDKQEEGKRTVIIYLGDHDPSGLDMVRDIEDRLKIMGATEIEVMPVALTWAQIQQYNPPPNPAKITDSRATDYIAQHGNESWELDALEPAVLEALIEENILALRDENLWAEAEKVQDVNKALMTSVSSRWEEVVRFLQGDDDNHDTDNDDDDDNADCPDCGERSKTGKDCDDEYYCGRCEQYFKDGE